MQFSVIVPTHHRPEKLRLLLLSLEAQSMAKKQFEVLVVPSPQDPGVLNLPSFSFSLQILSPQEDPYKGTSASFKRNLGAQKAQAHWIAFIDDDCVADKDWLTNAAQKIAKMDCQGLEGLTVIPVPEQITYTYKGLQRLSTAGGYQTCNMFYQRAAFLKCGGFDLKFPFYLEDTDMAWTLLDQGHQIEFAPECKVAHPVPAADVDRLLFNAYRVRLIPYLYRKHPKLFRERGWRALQRFHWLFLFVHIMLLYWMTTNFNLLSAAIGFAAVMGLGLAYTAYQLRGCRFAWNEAFKMWMYFMTTPWISLFQLWRGNFEQKTFVWR